MKSNHIVFTTVHRPDVLFDLVKNLEQHGHLHITLCWVVGDNKTPTECAEICKEVTNLGLETRYLDISKQDEWGRRFQDFYSRIPYDNESRRNIGYLYALEHGCERLISIDDDNFPTSGDFLAGHLHTGRGWEAEIIEEPSGFHNVCEYLEIELSKGVSVGISGQQECNHKSQSSQWCPNRCHLGLVVKGSGCGCDHMAEWKG